MDGSTRIFAAGILLCRFAVLLAAPGVVASDVAAQFESPATGGTSKDAEPLRLLVLFDGRVLEGTITDRPGGYLIEHSGGSEVIPYNLIRLAAASLDDAYVKQRDGLQKPTAGDHLALAQWCYEYKLYKQATEQLTASLKLEPSRTDAIELLKTISAVSPEQVGGKLAYITEPPIRDRSGTAVASASQAEFVRRVQPILVQRCGQARCHGSAATNDFKLINVRGGRRQNRSETEANLASVLRHVTPQATDQSPLLRVLQDSASAAHSGLFSGQAGPGQLERIREWVELAAQERPGSTEPLWAKQKSKERGGVARADFTAPRDASSSQIEQAGLEKDLDSPLLIEIPRTARPIQTELSNSVGEESDASSGSTEKKRSNPVATQKGRTPTLKAADEDRTAFLRNILEQSRPDAFDPNEFNRQIHGGSRAK